MERRASIVSNAPSEALSTLDAAKKTDGNESVKSYVIQQQPKNYYKSVSDNKEIAKLASLLSTSINSNKKVSSTQYCLFFVCVYAISVYQEKNIMVVYFLIFALPCNTLCVSL